MAKKANKTAWIIWAIVLIILGAVGWKYFGNEITGSKAGVLNEGVVYLGMAGDSPSSQMMLGGGKNQLDSIWTANYVPDASDPVGQVSLRQLEYSIRSTVPPMTKAYLRQKGNTTILATASPVSKGYVATKQLVFDLPQGLVLKANIPTNLTVSMDYGTVDGVKIREDQPYMLYLANAKAVGLNALNVGVSYGTRESNKHYMFSNYLRFGFNNASPSGAATRRPNHTIAKFNASAAVSKSDITFRNSQNNYISIVLETQSPTGIPTTIYLKSGMTGTIFGTATADLSKTGKATVTFRFPTELGIPASMGVLNIVTDTTKLIGEPDRDLLVSVVGDNALGWGISSVGNYHHGNIIFGGNITRMLNF